MKLWCFLEVRGKSFENNVCLGFLGEIESYRGSHMQARVNNRIAATLGYFSLPLSRFSIHACIMLVMKCDRKKENSFSLTSSVKVIPSLIRRSTGEVSTACRDQHRPLSTVLLSSGLYIVQLILSSCPDLFFSLTEPYTD